MPAKRAARSRPAHRASSAPAPRGQADAVRHVETFEDVDLTDAVVLLAFPSAGSASSIAAQYLVRHLNLPLVGHFVLAPLRGLVAVQEGRVTSAVRIYGGAVQCRVGRDCPKVYLVTTELVLPPPVLPTIADAVVGWAGAGGAHMALVLEAVVRPPDDESPDVFAAAADPKVLAALRESGLPPMERALLAGITAQVLFEAPRRGLAAGGILVEASRDIPDGRAAAALVEAIAKLIPDMVVDAGPLMHEATRLEQEIHKARQQSAAGTTLPPGTFV